MEYQKIINLLDDTTNQPSQFRTRNYSNMRFKTSVIRSNLCDYSDAYVLVKNCASFTNCITEINNTQVDAARKIDVVMPMYNLIEYSDAHSKASGSLWQCYRDEPAIDANGNIIDFPGNDNNSNSFKFKQ